jgi:hypothetical protein
MNPVTPARDSRRESARGPGCCFSIRATASGLSVKTVSLLLFRETRSQVLVGLTLASSRQCARSTCVVRAALPTSVRCSLSHAGSPERPADGFNAGARPPGSRRRAQSVGSKPSAELLHLFAGWLEWLGSYCACLGRRGWHRPAAAARFVGRRVPCASSRRAMLSGGDLRSPSTAHDCGIAAPAARTPALGGGRRSVDTMRLAAARLMDASRASRRSRRRVEGRGRDP